MYEQLIRPMLFRADPERVHNLSLRCCELAGRFPPALAVLRRWFGAEIDRLAVEVMGIRFPNPIGLAAGYDKNARGVAALAAMGFGHIEIGSVSAYPSAGNPKPRLFRLPEDRGIIAHYGLPNDGADAVAARLRGRRFAVPVGINLVKTNDPARPATDDEVFSDYERSFQILHDCGDYFCLNLSCPNTPDGRAFFDDVPKLDGLLARLARAQPTRPVLLKLKPTQDGGYLREIVAVSDRYTFLRGFEINLPPGKPPELCLSTPRERVDRYPGAVSGKPVEGIINASLAALSRILGPRSRYTLIAAGGVFTAEDAYTKLRLGASLVQLYTGLIYRGPGIVREILEGLLRLLDRERLSHIADAVGGAIE